MAYVGAALGFVAGCAAFAALLDVPAPDESTTSLLGLAVAGVGLVVALAAAREAGLAASAADESLKMARREHAVFMAEIQARAAFSLTLAARDAGEDGHVVASTQGWSVHVIIGVKNTGQKAAREANVTLVVPQGIPGLQWTLPPHGLCRETEERLAPTVNEPEGPEGQWISKLHPYIGHRTFYEFHAQFAVNLLKGQRMDIPMRCKVESDDLPDDAPEPAHDAIITVIRPPR